MLDEERDLEADEEQPEVNFAQALVELLAGHLGPPEVQAGEEHEDDRAEDRVVEVGHDEVAVGHVEVQWRRRQDDAGQTTEEEGDHEAHGPQHRGVETDRAPPHGADPVEEFHACRNGDEHRHEGEERKVDRAGDVHVVRPHGNRQGTDGHRGEHQTLVTEDRLAGEDRDDLAGDAEERQSQDVDLRMPEEPEQVLPQDRATIGWVEDHCPEVPVDESHDERSSKDGEGQQHENAGDEDRPREQRHAEHRHAGCTHAEDGRDEVDATEDRAQAAHRQTEEPQVRTHLR